MFDTDLGTQWPSQVDRIIVGMMHKWCGNDPVSEEKLLRQLIFFFFLTED